MSGWRYHTTETTRLQLVKVPGIAPRGLSRYVPKCSSKTRSLVPQGHTMTISCSVWPRTGCIDTKRATTAAEALCNRAMRQPIPPSHELPRAKHVVLRRPCVVSQRPLWRTKHTQTPNNHSTNRPSTTLIYEPFKARHNTTQEHAHNMLQANGIRRTRFRIDYHPHRVAST